MGVLDAHPCLISTFQHADYVTNGAVSVLGTDVSIIGASVIGIAEYLLCIVVNPCFGYQDVLWTVF